MIQRWFSTNPLSPEDERGLPTLFWRILAAVVVVRAVVIATAPVDLAGDEAYYWDWSRRLALGYFSKPPAIAWIMALAGWLGHDSVFGLRMAANLMTGGAAIFVFLLGRSVYGVPAGFLAGVAFLATPATAALGFLMTIDAPLVLCWSAALYFAWRLLIRDEASPVRTLALVLSIALGMLAKQMMMLFPLLLLVFVCLHAPLRDRLRRPGFWFVILAPYLALLAPLGWNFRHDWITVRQTAAHFGGNADSMARMFRHITEFVLAEAVLVTPVGYILVLAIALFGLAAWPRLSAAERYLTIFGAPGLLATLAMTATQHVNANWPSSALPTEAFSA